MSYALCFHPGRGFGLRSTYSRYSDRGVAHCDGTDSVLTGWDSGTDLNGLQRFEPTGSAWRAQRPVGASTAYVLCARRWAKG